MTEPEMAYGTVLVEEGYIIALATENEPGYHRLEYGPYESEEHARKVCDALNARAGVSPRRALLIVGSSMFPAPAKAHAERRASWDALEGRA